MKKQEFAIGVNDAGQRADKFLLKACRDLPQSLLYKTFRKRDVKLNGKRIPAETFLQAGDCLTVFLPDDIAVSARKAVPSEALPMPEIAYEDGEIVLMKKPVDLPVHADDKGSRDTMAARFLAYLTQTGAYDALREQSFSPALCNRLDRNTEGFVIGAKTAAALRTMNEKIRLGEVQKEYLCITAGIPPKREDTVTAYHRRLPGKNAEYAAAPREGFREMRTGYRVIAAREDGLALVHIRLYTGRTHQIRLQMAALGCPVLGDGRYGDPAVNRKYHEQHQLLAACMLSFPFSAEETVCDALRGKRFSYQPGFCAKYGFQWNET